MITIILHGHYEYHGASLANGRFRPTNDWIFHNADNKTEKKRTKTPGAPEWGRLKYDRTRHRIIHSSERHHIYIGEIMLQLFLINICSVRNETSYYTWPRSFLVENTQKEQKKGIDIQTQSKCKCTGGDRWRPSSITYFWTATQNVVGSCRAHIPLVTGRTLHLSFFSLTTPSPNKCLAFCFGK